MIYSILSVSSIINILIWSGYLVIAGGVLNSEISTNLTGGILVCEVITLAVMVIFYSHSSARGKA